MKPIITIIYCTQCQWLLRSQWLAAEILSTFGIEIGQVRLEPSTGGVFQIYANETKIWDRKIDGGFPQSKELKQKIAQTVLPDWKLGDHISPDFKA